MTNKPSNFLLLQEMKVFQNLEGLPIFRNAVITIGSFDGVHTGHSKILDKVKQLAQDTDGESIVITFHPHPRHVIFPDDDSLKLLNTVEEKANLLKEKGIDHIVVVPFSKAFAQQSPETYIQDFLIKNFNPSHIVIGYDHRFGKNRAGNIDYLKKFEVSGGFKVVEIQKQEVEDITVSSTKIRKAISKGDLKIANNLLRYNYALTGTVERGQGLGRQLGYPTANLKVLDKHKLIPCIGIYAVYAHHQNTRYEGMLYIGNRPTIEGVDNLVIEVNIFDFDKDIYDESLKIEFLEFLRGDAQFENLDALKAAIAADKISAEATFSNIKSAASKKKTTAPKVAVVILNYNGLEHLKTFLPAVVKTSYPNHEIYIADNASTDQSTDYLTKHFPKIPIIKLNSNHGFAKGYNLALQQVEADYFVLLNSDVEVQPNWIEPVIKLMESDKEIAACQPKILSYTNKSKFEHAGAAGGWIDHLGYPFCRGRIFDVTEKDTGQYETVSEIFWASGAALFIRADHFLNFGGFDPDFFAHVEEIDLCWRLKKAGYKIMVQPASVVYHLGGGTLAYQSPNKTYLNFRNSLYMLFKNESIKKLLWLIPFRLILDGIAGVHFLLSGKFNYIPAIIKAHWHFFGKIKQLVTKRKHYNELITQQSISKTENKSAIYGKSIIVEHYLKGKKKFNEIL